MWFNFENKHNILKFQIIKRGIEPTLKGEQSVENCYRLRNMRFVYTKDYGRLKKREKTKEKQREPRLCCVYELFPFENFHVCLWL